MSASPRSLPVAVAVILALLSPGCSDDAPAAGPSIANSSTQPPPPSGTATSTAAATSTTVSAVPTMPILGLALDPPTDIPRCGPTDLDPLPGGGSLFFVRLGNRRGIRCGLAGFAGLEGRRSDGTWATIPTVPLNQPVTNGPPWTGSFSTSLVAVLGFRETACATSATRTSYEDARLVLPDGAGTVVLSIAFDVSACPVQVMPFSADSQDR